MDSPSTRNPLLKMLATDTLFSRRALLKRSAVGFGSLALASLLASESQVHASEENPLAAKTPHFPARAKRIIFLLMCGGPSQVDTFDPKPLLTRDDGKPLPFPKPRVQFNSTSNLLKSPWKFQQYGQSGLWVSELFPKLAERVDDLCMVHSVYGTNPAHGGAMMKLHTGSDNFVRPSMGSWVSYGLGTDNANLPAFVTICPSLVRYASRASLSFPQAWRISTWAASGATWLAISATASRIFTSAKPRFRAFKWARARASGRIEVAFAKESKAGPTSPRARN